jgi:hypothetical protein
MTSTAGDGNAAASRSANEDKAPPPVTGGAAGSQPPWWRRRSWWRAAGGGAPKALAGLVAFLVAATGLLFAVDPSASPCLSATDAAFTGAPVFPGTTYVQYIKDLGYAPTSAERHYGSGYEVRYSIHTEGLRGDSLYLYTTLVKINRDGTIERVIPDQDLKPRVEDTPNECGWTEGSAFLVQTRLQRNGRYRFVLELYEGRAFRTRVALTETPTFDG